MLRLIVVGFVLLISSALNCCELNDLIIQNNRCAYLENGYISFSHDCECNFPVYKLYKNEQVVRMGNEPFFDQLESGLYTLEFRCGIQILIEEQFEITTASPEFTAHFDIYDTCFSQYNFLQVIPIGGTPTYTISWIDGVEDTDQLNSFMVNNLSSGRFWAFVRDSNDCRLRIDTFVNYTPNFETDIIVDSIIM